ncbi:glycosyltransferase family 2 protein [Riemerella anatipestifer]|uniref:Chondroitin synthase n=2 Tax=Riemerella anatipestifer TaxID=34085 RepID=A0A1S7DT57_RIEAN|nr:glycosyltransferase family 2 protein [Riemerella anatipestifer]AQY22287.1 Chondroitin synthase [Riemerella anatipestifer]MDY3327940.1 glycosyltransferase family 2 protein [Riemerella anatipestifer]
MQPRNGYFMKFSILVAHYNNYNYFLDCYKSIINQTHQNFEVILVDDCSDDGSLEKIQNLVKNDTRFKIIKNEENKGVGYTKRKCIELATGDICGFVDPDDAIIPSAIEKSIEKYLEKDTIVATHSNISVCDEKLNYIRDFKGTRKVKNSDSFFFNIDFSVNHFFTFKKLAYDKTSGIDKELTSAVDQDLYLKIYEQGNFAYINENLYLYRIHEKGVSQDKSKKDKLNHNWHKVLLNTLKRRKVGRIYGRNIDEINNLPKFLFEKENSFFKKLIRKFIK